MPALTALSIRSEEVLWEAEKIFENLFVSGRAPFSPFFLGRDIMFACKTCPILKCSIFTGTSLDAFCSEKGGEKPVGCIGGIGECNPRVRGPFFCNTRTNTRSMWEEEVCAGPPDFFIGPAREIVMSNMYSERIYLLLLSNLFRFLSELRYVDWGSNVPFKKKSKQGAESGHIWPKKICYSASPSVEISEMWRQEVSAWLSWCTSRHRKYFL